MADARISQLPSASTISANDVLPFTSISASETQRITANSLGLVLTQLGLTVGSSAPSNPAPYNGQLWVDTSTNPPVLKLFNGATFTTVSFLPGSSVSTSPSSTAPSSPVLGQLWLDTSQTPDELKVYDGAAFVRVDPLGITDTAAAAKYLQIANAATTYLALAGGTMTGDLTLAGNPTTNNMASNKAYVDTQIAAIPAATDQTPAGTVIYSARATPPTGYVIANGVALSRTVFSGLFAAIGTTYGAGDGSSTFNIPDLRGEFVRGLDEGRGVDSGRALGSFQSSQNITHNHNASGGAASGTFVTGVIFSKGTNEVPNTPDEVNVLNASTSIDTPTGSVSYTQPTIQSDGGTEARPRNVALLPCIKY